MSIVKYSDGAWRYSREKPSDSFCMPNRLFIQYIGTIINRKAHRFMNIDLEIELCPNIETNATKINTYPIATINNIYTMSMSAHGHVRGIFKGFAYGILMVRHILSPFAIKDCRSHSKMNKK